MNITVAKNQGFTLIEMMIALVLGLLITLAVVQTFVFNNKSIVLQREAIATQEEGRVALDMMARYIRMAGYQENDLAGVILTDGINGTDAANKDMVAIRYEAGSSMSTPITDCLGNTTSSAGAISLSEFKINANNDLVCNHETAELGATATVTDDGILASNVEQMVILYGEDTDGDQVANRFVAASAADMENIIAVRICLIVTSSDFVTQTTIGYFDCTGAAVTNPGDQRLRRKMSTTITLRNRVGVAS